MSHVFPYNKQILSMGIGLDELRRDDGDKRLASFLEFVTLIYHATDPLYGFGMLSYRLEAIDVEVPPPISDKKLAENRINHPTWLMLFPPEMVEAYGREWLKSLPAARIDSLDDGGLLVITTMEVTDADAVYEAMQNIEQAFDEIQ